MIRLPKIKTGFYVWAWVRGYSYPVPSNQSVTRPRAPAGSNTGIDMEIEDGREMVCGGKGDLQQLAVLHEQYSNQC